MISAPRPSQTPFFLLLVAFFWGLSSATAEAGLQLSTLGKRQAQATAECPASFSWTQNENGNSPCLLAAKVHLPCSTGSYTVTALLPNSHYNRPQNETANSCSCSWLAYNLLMACTACQDQPNSIFGWPMWSQHCGNNLSKTSFPENIPLPSDASIPFWAQKDPLEWTGARFNVLEAKALFDEGHPDQDLGTTAAVPDAPKKTSVGVIVGAVVAAGVGAVIIVALLLMYLRKRRMANGRSQGGTVPLQRSRSDSDVVQKYRAQTSPSPDHDWRSNTSGFHSRGDSGGTLPSHLPSLPYQWSSSVITPPQSPPPTQTEAPLENRISPFPMSPQMSDRTMSPDYSISSRTTKGTVVVSPTLGMIGSSTNRPTELEASTVPAFSEAAFNTTTDDHAPLVRLNPPAYTETPDPSEIVSISGSRPPLARSGHRRGFPSSYDSTGSYNGSTSSLRMSVTNAPSIAVVERSPPSGYRAQRDEPEM